MEAYFEKPPCRACRHFAEKRNEETDCENCLPDIFEENVEAATVFPFVYDQMILAPSGKVIAINLNTVFKTMEMLKVKYPEQCLNKIRFLFNELIIRKST